jgi:alkaline phosphatase D
MRRRIFLAALSSAALPVRTMPQTGPNPFTSGVTSGDPLSDSVVLWTRLAVDPLNGGGMPNQNIAVDWEIAEDDQLRRIVKKGTAMATPGLGHSVHVEVKGLRAERPYWFRFRSGGHASNIARTRTAPRSGSKPARLNFAFASCQHFEQGYYTAYEHMAKEDLDLVVHLGDYIYEYGPTAGRVRQHNSPEIVSINDYRNRYALYRSDANLRRMHELAPWIVTWDDHEVDNNYANDTPEDSQPRDKFLERRANAYQAYYENMPLRASSIPAGSRMQLYRNLAYGDLAQFHVLDTRQYRTDQPCGDKTTAPCGGERDPNGTIMGTVQREWLFNGLAKSRATWNVIAQQVLMAKIDTDPGPAEAYSMDQWSGYEVERQRVMDFLAERKPSNPVVITGDIHSHWVADLKQDVRNEKSAIVGSEFTGTSISSAGDGADIPKDQYDGFLRANPHLKFFSRRRGYVSCQLTPQSYRADYRELAYVSKPGAPLTTAVSYVIENGKPGVQKA